MSKRVCRFPKEVNYWRCPHLDSLKNIRVMDLRSLGLIKVIFRKVAAFYFLGSEDWESSLETV